jgi:hypothetical protein
MNLAEMLRGNPLAQQRLADNFAMNKQGDLARMMQQHGTVQDPARVQEQSVLGNLPIDVPQPTQADMLMGADQVMNLMPQAGIFAGIGSKTANKLALQKAQDLAGQGVDRKQIWDETGWYNDVDGKWKYEIDDSGMKVRDFRPTGGGISIKHDELYKAYPESINTKVVPTNTVNEGEAAVHPTYDYGNISGHKGAILVNDQKIPSKDVFAHELQHLWPQKEEGFARGGSPSNFGQQKEAELARDARSWMRELARKKKTMPDADRIAVENSVVDEYSNMGAMDWLPSKEARDLASEPYLKNPNDMKNLEELIELYGLNQKTTPSSDMDLYQRLAGEAEARNVQTRMDFTPQQRQAQPPWETLDVPENELLVRMLTGQ